MTLSATPFKRAFSRAIAIAAASMSQASICAPERSFAAAIARIPVPVPTSRKLPPAPESPRAQPALGGRKYFSIAARHKRVVSWVPVPKAMPGSMRITIRSWLPASSAQGGAMMKCWPTFTGCQLFFHSPNQSSSATSRTFISLTEAEGKL